MPYFAELGWLLKGASSVKEKAYIFEIYCITCPA
jgi:hypothetical protein